MTILCIRIVLRNRTDVEMMGVFFMSNTTSLNDSPFLDGWDSKPALLKGSFRFLTSFGFELVGQTAKVHVIRIRLQ